MSFLQLQRIFTNRKKERYLRNLQSPLDPPLVGFEGELAPFRSLWYGGHMPSHATKPAPGAFGLLPPLPPEGPELDALIKARVSEADANPTPGIPMTEVFKGLRKRYAEQAQRRS